MALSTKTLFFIIESTPLEKRIQLQKAELSPSTPRCSCDSSPFTCLKGPWTERIRVDPSGAVLRFGGGGSRPPVRAPEGQS